MYKHFIRPILFHLNPETAHNFTMKSLTALRYVPLGRTFAKMLFKPKTPNLSREVFGITFPNPLGLSGGFDKNGEHYNDLANFGFGFVEIGSLTVNPQEGNPKPRLFRLPSDKALINRMGINNKGVRYAIDQLIENKPKVIIAANIAKNSSSLNDEAGKDFETAFARLYDYVDMFVLNISCPNVESLSELQDISFLSEIVDRLLSMRMYYTTYRPIIIKVSPDISLESLDRILDYCMSYGIDGIIACNTTRKREGLKASQSQLGKIGKGGLSGAPLYKKTLDTVRYIHQKTEGNLPIIASGGISTPEQAQEMLDAGASLIEIYTSFIYEGPSAAKNILKHLEANAIARKNE